MLETLPDELLEHIVSHLPHAQSVARLARTCRNLHQHVEQHGWRTFTRTRFPCWDIASATTNWQDASQTLTALVRDWQRRAFRTRYIEPSINYISASGQPLRRWRRPNSQTIGFLSVIDSHQVQLGSRLSDVRQTIAWGAGSELLLRRRGPETTVDGDWLSYKAPGAREGIDDITTLHILKQTPDHTSDQVLVGTARGDLSLLKVPAQHAGAVVQTRFNTACSSSNATYRKVHTGALLEIDDAKLFATHLMDGYVTLYRVQPDEQESAPIDRLRMYSEHDDLCCVNALLWLTRDTLACTQDGSRDPLKLYQLTPSGLAPDPIRSLSCEASRTHGQCTLHAIETLGSNPGSGDNTTGHGGKLLLSAGSHHKINLHDLRSSRPVEQVYEDPHDDTGTYSLLTRGANNFLAGSMRDGIIKSFDLRMPNVTEYTWLNSEDKTDWKTFLHALPTSAVKKRYHVPKQCLQRSAHGSVYSLSSPSPWSPYIFAGVEHAVVEMKACSVAEASLEKKSTHRKSMYGEMNLPMYSMGGESRSWHQRSVEDVMPKRPLQGLATLDERCQEQTYMRSRIQTTT